MFVHSSAHKILLPSKEFPFIVNNQALRKKQKLVMQISYPKQFETAIVRSTGALIAALKAREVEVSQGCSFNRIG
jgi:hypothetical protein